MGDHNIEPLFDQSQAKKDLKQIVCILCDGTHSNDTWCQADLNITWSN